VLHCHALHCRSGQEKLFTLPRILVISVFRVFCIYISVADLDSLNPDSDTDQDPAFQVNPDLDPGQGLITQKFKKIQLQFFSSFIDQKLQERPS
jgi:hypothetical protein